MKKFFFILALFISVFEASTAQTCSNFLFLQKGKTVEMTSYHNEKPDMKMTYVVQNVTTSAGTTTGTVHSKVEDKKGRLMSESDNKIQCVGGNMMMDMRMMVPQQQGKGAGSMSASTSDFYIEYPSSMKVGDKLKDGHMSMDVENHGTTQNITMDITERNVEGKEKITTTAGSWDCFKISSHYAMKIRTMGIGIPIKMDVTEWYAPSFGQVKSETKYGTTEITSIK